MSDAIELAERVQRAGEAIDRLDPEACAAAIELREAVEEIHAEGLRELVRVLLADERGAQLLRDAARLPTARTILMLHGIVRRDIAAQAEDVLARLRPALAAIGGDVLLDHVEGSTLFVRLVGACEGQSATARAYQEQVCEVLAAQVEGLDAVEVSPSPPPPVVVPLDSMLRRVQGSRAAPSRAADAAPVDGARPAAQRDANVGGDADHGPAGATRLGEPNAVADSLRPGPPRPGHAEAHP